MTRPVKRPIKRVLDPEAVDEAMVQRVWRGVDARRARPRTRPMAWSFAAVGVTAAAAAFLLWPGEVSVAIPGPVHIASSAVLEGDVSVPVTLDEGSQIVPSRGGVVSILENGPSAITALVSEGRARFEITPGGPRRWTLECGLAQVEVVGTVFTIDRSADRVRVEVERGVVLVRSPHLVEGVVRLQAGQAVAVEATEEVASAPPRIELTQTPDDLAPDNPMLDDLAPEGLAPEDSSDATERTGVLSIERRLQQADAARDAGDPHRAETILLEALAERPTDPQRGLAWTTIARLRMRQGRAGAAGDAFGQALDEHLPDALVEEVMVRRVEAYARTARADDTRAAADAHAARFPDSNRRDTVRALLED